MIQAAKSRPLDPDLPDLIVPWPVNLDYPPFRLFLRMYRNFFNQVFIVFTPIESMWNFTEEVMRHMAGDYVLFIKTDTYAGKDWRDVATNAALNLVASKHVLFMEQDFMIRGGSDLKEIWKQREYFDVIGFKQEERLHPAFLLAAMRQIEKTSKYFGTGPNPGEDHFYKLTEELKAKPVLLDDLGIKAGAGYKHMNGLSHNFHLCMRGETPTFRPEEFKWYLKRSHYNIPVSQKYKDLIKLCKKQMGMKGQIDGVTDRPNKKA